MHLKDLESLQCNVQRLWLSWLSVPVAKEGVTPRGGVITSVNDAIPAYQAGQQASHDDQAVLLQVAGCAQHRQAPQYEGLREWNDVIGHI